MTLKNTINRVVLHQPVNNDNVSAPDLLQIRVIPNDGPIDAPLKEESTIVETDACNNSSGPDAVFKHATRPVIFAIKVTAEATPIVQKKKRQWPFFILTMCTLQVIMFGFELGMNAYWTGSAIQTDPFNYMIGPSGEVCFVSC